MAKRVGILIFDDVEVLDFAGPFKVFATATRSGDLGREDDRLFHVFTVAVSPRTVRGPGRAIDRAAPLAR